MEKEKKNKTWKKKQDMEKKKKRQGKIQNDKYRFVLVPHIRNK